jgi:recombination protein RecA
LFDDFNKDLMKAIDKKFNRGGKHDILYKQRDLDSAPSGSCVMDFVCSPDVKGAVGYAIKGKITEILGQESSGKSTSIYETAVKALAKGWNVLLIDSEGSFDPRYARALGLKIGNNFQVVRPIFGEDVDKLVNMITGWGKGNTKTQMKIDLILFDSVASIKPKALLESEDSTGAGGTKGLHASFWGNLVAKLNMIAQDRDIAIVLVNQLRDKINISNKWEEKTITNPNSLASGLNSDDSKYATGGNAIKFYASIRILLQHGRRPKLSRKVRGKEVETKTTLNYVKIRTIKNKVYSPNIEATTAIQYGKGYRDELPIFDYLKDAGIITATSAGVYSIDTKKLKLEVRGLKNFQKELFSNHLEALKDLFLKERHKEFLEMYEINEEEALEELLDDDDDEFFIEEDPKPKTKRKSKKS